MSLPPRSLDAVPLGGMVERNRVPVLLSVGIYAGGVIIGSTLMASMSGLPAGGAVETGQVGLSTDQALTPWVLLSHNGSVLAMFLSGALTFGVSTTFFALLNGIIFGIVVTNALGNSSALLTAAAVVPHALLELPAFWLAGAVGLLPAHQLYRYLASKQDEILPTRTIRDMLYMTLAAFVLLAVAAFIEALLTPALVGLIQ